MTWIYFTAAVLIAAILTIFILRLLFEIFILLQGPFYAGTSEDRIEAMLELLELKKAETAIDLGSGDGRLLIALAEAGVEKCVGYELDPWQVLRSRRNIRRAKLEQSVNIIAKNFWNADISQADIIVMYGISHVMEKLSQKIQSEAKLGAQIISIGYKLPEWKPEQELSEVGLYRQRSVGSQRSTQI